MDLDIQDMINGRLGVGAALWFGRSFPPAVGYRLGGFLADRFGGRRRAAMVRAVCANQWVVSDGTLSSDQLDRRTRDTFRHTARCLFDLYHNLNDAGAMRELVRYEPAVSDVLEKIKSGRQAYVIVGPHMSNFDFVARAMAIQGVPLMALAYATPGSGYKWQNKMRRESGIDIVPASMTSLRQAIRRLEEGGSVITGMDRPLPDSKYHPRFFGRSAALSVMHVVLALKTNLPLVVMSPVMRPDGIYVIKGCEPFMMEPHPDRHTEIVQNAERALAVAEGFIAQAPHQWSMFYPVWPEVMEEMKEERV
ncbi:MAG: hypothetical protein JXD18_05860 [Anaerolineae bacterium]|nr:hypothetical protein [Anaerolineae bacterium]